MKTLLLLSCFCFSQLLANLPDEETLSNETKAFIEQNAGYTLIEELDELPLKRTEVLTIIKEIKAEFANDELVVINETEYPDGKFIGTLTKNALILNGETYPISLIFSVKFFESNSVGFVFKAKNLLAFLRDTPITIDGKIYYWRMLYLFDLEKETFNTYIY